MIRMYSKKYFCPRCRENFGELRRLYGEIMEDGSRGLFCDRHGYQQKCNCSPSEMEMVIVPDEKDEPKEVPHKEKVLTLEEFSAALEQED